jgi:hypothetical protein
MREVRVKPPEKVLMVSGVCTGRMALFLRVELERRDGR